MRSEQKIIKLKINKNNKFRNQLKHQTYCLLKLTNKRVPILTEEVRFVLTKFCFGLA